MTAAMLATFLPALVPAWLAAAPATQPRIEAPRSGSAPLATARADVDGDGEPDAITVTRGAKGIVLTVDASRAGKLEKKLGRESVEFLFEGTSARLAARDLDGDGRAEILASAEAAGRGRLYVLKVVPQAGGNPLVSLHPDADAFVSSTGRFPDAFSVSKTGAIEVAGEDFTDEGPVPTVFRYEIDRETKSYKLAGKKPSRDP